MHYIIFSFILFLFQSCTDQSQKSLAPVRTKIILSDSTTTTNSDLKSQKFELNEVEQSYFKFAGSVETEILKIVEPSFKKTLKIPSQLLILSQLIELKLNIKTKLKNADIFYNCSQIHIENPSQSEILVTPACEKKSQVMAKIRKISSQHYEVRFIQSEWKNVVGASALLNQKDKVCQIKISDKKVHEINCNDTLVTVGAGAQLEEIKLKNFIFYRTGQKQIVVDGGRFKDYLERSHINIMVPETGKINFKEEEILVKDEFEPVNTTDVHGEINSGVPVDAQLRPIETPQGQ